MSNDESAADDRSRQIDAAIAIYLEAAEQGTPLDQEAFLAQHADIADDLRQFLADHSVFKRNAPLAPLSDEPTTELSNEPGRHRPANNGVIRDVLRYFGDYELTEEIARGGMGVVYKARQATLNRTVAVKMILAGQLASQAEVDRFYAEAQAAAALDHPNIVPIFEVGKHQEQHYFSMGYVAGESLAQRLAAGPFPPREAATIMREVALAVHYAHGQGVIHRDLKPANILFDSDGHPRVTDFGLAKHQSDASGLTVTGQVLGTPSYMPPEQISGSNGQIGPAADVYSLGATLYALLTGRPPFQSASAVDTLKQVLDKDPVPLREFDAAVPRDLETITLKCLEKPPSHRYGSAKLLAEELDRYLTGRPILARPVRTTERAWRWCRRNPVIAALTTAVAAVLMVGTLVSTYFAVESDRRAQQEQKARQEAVAQRHRAEENATATKRQLYFTCMNLAQSAWNENHINALIDLLNRTQPNAGEEDYRGFEWHYWDRMAHGDLATYEFKSLGNLNYKVTKSTLSPDGKFAAWACDDHRARLFDIATNTIAKTLEGHTDAVTQVVFSADSKLLATASADRSIKIWDVAEATEKISLNGFKGKITHLAFRPDGLQIAAASDDQEIKRWKIATGELLDTCTSRDAKITKLALTADGELLSYTYENNTLTRWNTTTGTETAVKLEPRGEFSGVGSLTAISQDGKRLAIGGWGKLITLWDTTSGKKLSVLQGHTGAINNLAFSPDSTQLASASNDTTIKLWNAITGQEITTIKGHGDPVREIEFSIDGKRLVSGSVFGEIKIWDVLREQNPITLKPQIPDPNQLVSFSPDGKRVVSGGFGIDFWDVATNERSLRIKDNVWIQSLAYDPDGKQIAAACTDKTIRFWDTANGTKARILKGHINDISSIAISPDGKYLASASAEAIKLWDLTTGEESRTWRQWDYVFCIAFSPDGKQLAVYSDTIRLWDVATGKLTMTMELTDDKVLGTTARDGKRIAFSLDGKYLASAGIKTIKLWDLAIGKEIRSLTGHGRWSFTLAFSPDSKRLASGSDDMTIKVWDVASGQETLTLIGHTEKINCVTFSPDGNRIASTSADGTIKIWDARPRVFSGAVHAESLSEAPTRQE